MTRYISRNTKVHMINELIGKYNKGELMPRVTTPVVSDHEKMKELEKLAKSLQIMLELGLDEKARRSIKINARVLNHKTIAIDIVKTNTNINSLLHGSIYDPLAYTLIDIRGGKIDSVWGIKITIYIVKRIDKKLLRDRLFEILKRIVELESTYL